MVTSNLCKYLVLGLIIVLISITLFVTPSTNKPCVNCNKPSSSAAPTGAVTTPKLAEVNDADNKPKSNTPKLKPKSKPTTEKKVEFDTNSNNDISGYDGDSGGFAPW